MGFFVAVSIVTGEVINLSWIDRSRIEEAYHIEREIAGIEGFEEVSAELEANTESYSYEDLTQNGQLRYRVYASNEYGDSGYSNNASIIPKQLLTEDKAFQLSLFTDGHPVTGWGSYEPKTEGEWQSAVSLAVSHQQGSGGVPGQAYFDDISIYSGDGSRIGLEDFEMNLVGKFPRGWTVNPDWPWSESFNSVESDPMDPGNGKSFFLAGDGASVTGSFLPGSYDSGAIAAEFRIFIPGSNGSRGDPASFVFGGASAIAYVNEDQSVSVRLGHDDQTVLDGLTLDRWHRIRMELNPAAGKARLLLVSETKVISEDSIEAELASDGGSLLSRLVFAPGNRSDTRELTLVPKADEWGRSLITIDLITSGERLSKVFEIEIAPVNDPPSIDWLEDYSESVLEDGQLKLSLPLTDTDTDLSDLKVSASASDGELIESLALDFSDASGWVLTIVPSANRHGETEITLTVDDGEFKVSSSFDLTVVSVPDAPEFVGHPESLAARQGALSVTFAVEVADVDSRFEDLTIVPVVDESDVLLGSNIVSESPDGNFAISMTLNPNWSGSSVLRLTVTDETEEFAQAEIEIAVEAGPRVFFGTIGETGLFALYVDSEAEGTFLGWDPDGQGACFIEGFDVGVDGSFVVDGYLDGEGTISGAILGFGVSGLLSPSGKVFSGQQVAIDGPTSDSIGIYLGFLNELSGGIGRLIVGPNGRALAVLKSNSESVSDGAWVDVDGEGLLRGSWLGSSPFEMKLDPLTRRVTGGAEFAGLHWTVAVALDPNAQISRIANLSTRSWVGSGPASIIAGFAIEGSDSIDLLIRGIGPGLAPYGVTSALENPELLLRSGAAVIASNSDWNQNPDPEMLADVARLLGGFPLNPGSGDSALYSELGDGRFTAVVRPDGGTDGVALVELYDATLGGGSQLVNLSTRLVLRPSTAGTLGFVITGTTRVQFLIRAVGLGLESYGVEGVVTDPILRVFGGSDPKTPFLSNDNWSDVDEALIRSVSEAVGAFPLESGSPDAAVVVWLDPGVYSAKASDAGGGGGVVLTELYVVP